MSENTLFRARELIQQRKYLEARQILVTIDDPTAREWTRKIDEILYADPFAQEKISNQTAQVSSKVNASDMISSIVPVMLRNNWEVKFQSSESIQFEKKSGPSIPSSVLIILFLALIGTLIVCIMIAVSKKSTAFFQIDREGKILVTTTQGAYQIHSLSDAENIAKSVKTEMTYSKAITVGVVIAITYGLVIPLGLHMIVLLFRPI